MWAQVELDVMSDEERSATSVFAILVHTAQRNFQGF